MKMIYKDKSPLDKASLWSKALFSWAYPLINYARTNQISVEIMGTVNENDRVEL